MRTPMNEGADLPIPPDAATLTAALASDALDRLGRRNRCLGWDLVPLDPTSRIVGRAFPVTVEAVDRVPDVPYRGLLASLEGLGEGDVYVIPTRRSDRAAVWGELVSTAARARGAVGALTDGLVRDTAMVRSMGFPVIARGSIPSDTNGRLETIALAEAGVIDGVTITRGDLIVADGDGVVVIPADLVGEVVSLVQEKVRGEAAFRAAVAAGELPTVAFERYRVL